MGHVRRPDDAHDQSGSQAGEAWAANNTGGRSVYVGVIDEGIQVSHPDLLANTWTNPFDPADGMISGKFLGRNFDGDPPRDRRAALYASTRPLATAAEIREAIMLSAVPTSSLTGKTVTGGRLNVSGF